MKRCKLVVLISGSGTNLQAVIDACIAGTIKGEVAAVISNRPDAYGLERAMRAGIPQHVVNHKDFPDRASFDQALMELIDSYSPSLLLLAGFMRILTDDFTAQYPGRMINIHPSRLPDYRGLKTHQRVLDNGESKHGASVHFVTAELDGGPVILQSEIEVRQDHNEYSLFTEVQETEHRMLPLVMQWFCDGQLLLKGGTVYYLGKAINKPIQLHDLDRQPSENAVSLSE